MALTSREFLSVLDAVHGFHDGAIGCAYFGEPSEQMVFVEQMYFGSEYLYNPKPILGGVFWFDLPVPNVVREIGNFYGREIGSVVIDSSSCTISFQLQDAPYEAFEIKFGSEANFQFVTSSPLEATPLQRRMLA
ncbi:hypothetical protein [Defluviimonas sp. SAOS-178_SWC]|uniref:hypothetical protein n=1 Tax=Defluviimonas sp. SAOS-178_SWC TaxID=3121287 RepID=UPI003221959D